jgi:glycogen debranching enzyme
MHAPTSADTVASANPEVEHRTPTAQFFISATSSLQERRPLTLKHDDTFAVFDHNGDAIAAPGSPEGIYHRDTRYLSAFALMIDGERPILLSSTMRDDNTTLTCDLSNPDLFDAAGQMILEHDILHVRRSRFLWRGACYERFSVRNFGDRKRRVQIDVGFSADFADLFEVRGAKRARRGALQPPVVNENQVQLSYLGLDDRLRCTRLRFDPTPLALTAECASFVFELDPHQAANIVLDIACDASDEAPVRNAFSQALRASRRALRSSTSRAASIISSNEIFNEAARRSISDLYMLITETPEGPYPYAGIPWFSTVFGRDALITALQTLWLDPDIARGVLLHLAVNQATGYDAAADAEPGKILHEVRYGEMAELKEVPFRRYYGSVDSTPLFVMLAGAYFERTGDLSTLRRLWPNLEAALGWIEKDGDRDNDGFVEYGRQTEKGLANQGWKDSHDSIFHADGALATGPIALAEVQAYVYGAWRAAAEIARALGQVERAAGFDQRADTLRTAFDAAFFDETLGTYALALDGNKRPCLVRSSNAGHVLLTGLALPERAAAVARTLMSPAQFCGWGIRTIASGEVRYNPMSYHNGSVWPHDNALIAAGLARYGFKQYAARIFEALFAASVYIDLRRLPELFCGFARQRTLGPTSYPVACMPQAWAATAPLSMLKSCLGLSFDPARLQLTFDKPALPNFLHEVTLRNLRLGGAGADVSLRRSGSEVVVDVLDRRGSARVLTIN